MEVPEGGDSRPFVVDAQVVGDSRDSRPRRLAIVGLGLLVITGTYFAYNQSVRNGEALIKSQDAVSQVQRSLDAANQLLVKAAQDRRTLIESNARQQELITALQEALIAQTQVLIDAGLGVPAVPSIVAPLVPSRPSGDLGGQGGTGDPSAVFEAFEGPVLAAPARVG